MPLTIKILDINPGSDGDGRKWPKHGYIRNDPYFLERIATDKWIKDLPGGAEDSVVYRLNKLPQGYAGFEKARPDDKHVDRYIYGHPNGQFRSLNEFYPHFKHLMDHGEPSGCECVKCKASVKKSASGAKATESGNDSTVSGRPQRSQYFPDRQKAQNSDAVMPDLISPFKSKHGAAISASESPKPRKRKLIDCEGTTDVYETMIARLKEAGPEEVVDLPIEERMSPDWRAGNTTGQASLKQWQNQPRYIPRIGEIVLFVRKLGQDEVIAWDRKYQTFRCRDIESHELRDRPKWEAGIVTQMPTERISDGDLVSDASKEEGVNYSGYRVEPLSEICNEHKPYNKQHKHVPLHLIRPFSLWQHCLNGVTEEKWHPTIKHALTAMSSFSIIGRFRFRGVWPNATVFARGTYIGAELITLGDTVRLLPRTSEQSEDSVTDVMVVTAIRLRFVNLGMDEEEIPTDLPYQTCLHFSGRVYTLDPTRSFDGVGKVPIDPNTNVLPPGLSAYGQWYHYSDPGKVSARTELPYTRILGRCFEKHSSIAWFGSGNKTTPLASFQAVNKKAVSADEAKFELSRGLQGIVDAREYSKKHDNRIKTQEGISWFWADTRVEQLDLHEVNGRSVGSKSELRTKGDMAKWRAALKALDGKKGGLEEYHAARKRQEAEERKQSSVQGSSAFGLMASGAQAGTESATEGEALDREDQDGEEEGMELDEEQEEVSSEQEEGEIAQNVPPKIIQPIDLMSSSEDEDEQAENQLVNELAKNIRPNDARAR